MAAVELIGIGMTVLDLPRAEAFYREGLGFVAGTETVIEDPAWARLMGLETAVTARSIAMRLGRQEIELVAFDPPGRPYPPESAANDQWFQHVALVVADMAAAWERLQRRSPTEISLGGPQTLPPNTGGVSAYKFRDPEGHPLELLQFPPGVGAARWHERSDAVVLGYDHSAIAVQDVDRSLTFYTDLLGFRVGGRSLNRGVEQDRLDGLGDCEVDVVGLEPADVATPHLELLGYRRPPGRTLDAEVRANDAASTRLVLRVDDLEGLAGRLRDVGAAFVSPGVVTLRDDGRGAAIRDPDGHMIVLVS